MSTTAVLDWPGEAGPSVGGQGSLPTPAIFEVSPSVVVVGESGDLPRVAFGSRFGMFGKEGLNCCAELRLFGRVCWESGDVAER